MIPGKTNVKTNGFTKDITLLPMFESKNNLTNTKKL